MFGRSQDSLLKRALALYAGEHVLEAVLRDGEKALKPGGRTVELTLLALDIAAMANVADTIAEGALADLFARYYETVTRTISAHGGTLDNFSGDALSAWWGSDGRPDHPQRACACAKQLSSDLAAMNARSHASGLPAVTPRIGIHTAPMRLGSYGSSTRLRYSVLGDGVNLAHRLCGLASGYHKCPIVISDATETRLGSGFSPVELDRVQVKGMEQPLILFSI